jgi:hypothetical protein
MRAILAVITFSVLFAACGGESAATPTVAPSPTPSGPIWVGGPYPEERVFPAVSQTDGYVLDIASGQLYVIHLDAALGPGADPGRLTWADDNSLTMPSGQGRFFISLETGTVTVEPSVQAVEPTPAPGELSADGLWRVVALTDGTSSFIGPDGISKALPKGIGRHTWSPAGHLLATGAGRCGDNEVAVFDPDTGDLRAVFGPPGSFIEDYLWRPDAKAIVADVLAPLQQLVLLDVTSGEVEPLAPLDQNIALAEVTPLAWSPDASKLLFRAVGAHDCSD